jgi:hypothetical protein
MFYRFILKYFPGDVQILVKIVFGQHPAFLIFFLQAGVEFSERKVFPGQGRLPFDYFIFPDKKGHFFYECKKGHSLDDNPETHEVSFTKQLKTVTDQNEDGRPFPVNEKRQV